MEEQTRVTEHISAEGAREAFPMRRRQAKPYGIAETGSQRQGRDELDGPLHTISLQGRLTPHPTQCPQEDAREGSSSGGKGPYDHSHKWIQLEVLCPCSREAGMSVAIAPNDCLHANSH